MDAKMSDLIDLYFGVEQTINMTNMKNKLKKGMQHLE